MSNGLRSAVIDGDYRYRLDRRLRVKGDRAVVFCMLNPSTADGLSDDPTLRRCIGFANAWGFDRLVVVNLFAYRATDPRLLDDVGVDSAVGPYNDFHIGKAVDEAARDDMSIICAWGAHPLAAARAQQVAPTLTRHGPTFALGETRDGSPRHPLYLPSSSIREPFGFPIARAAEARLPA